MLFSVVNFSLIDFCLVVLGVMAILQSAKPGSTFWSHATVVLILPYWSLTVALNVLITLAITIRLLLVRRFVISSLGREYAKTYTSVAAMVVESAAISAVTGLIMIICYARSSNVQNLVLPVLDHAAVCFDTLISLPFKI